MSKRFFYKMYTSGEVDFFDNEQEYVNEEYTCDDVGGLHPMDYWEVVELLNEQQATINELRLEQDFASRWQKESEMMSEHRYGVHDCPNGYYYLRDVTDHSVYVHRNYGKLYSDYKDDIELVSTLLNELADKVDERQATINELKEENEWLRQQLLYDGDDVCGICKHEYLVPSEDYFIAKCKKEHKECSKKDIKYCEDFELIQADFEDLIKRMDKELKE